MLYLFTARKYLVCCIFNYFKKIYPFMTIKTIRRLPFAAKGGRKAPRSENKSIINLHSFFTKIVKASGENVHNTIRIIAKRLTMSNRNRQPVKISQISNELKESNKVAVVVGKVLDDVGILELPAMKIVALKWSKSVQKKIEAFGGSIHTLDQFIKIAGSIENILLIQGDRDARKATKFFGLAPGERNSAAYPRQTAKGKNKEVRVNYKKPITFDIDSE